MKENTVYYDKLVRDKIPQIIEATGQSCITKVMEPLEYLKKLEEKLNEELSEYQQSKDIEELADLLEVMMAVAAARGHTWEQVLDIRQRKLEKRGGFDKRLLLQQVIQKENGL